MTDLQGFYKVNAFIDETTVELTCPLPGTEIRYTTCLLYTSKDMINKQLGDLNLQKNFGCTVTRVRRSGIDLSPSPDLALKFGDKLMVVGEKEGLKGVARLLGNNAKKLSDTYLAYSCIL